MAYKKKVYNIKTFVSGMNNEDSEFDLSVGEGKLCYNLKSVKGKLVAGNSIKELTLPTSNSLEDISRKLTFRTNKKVKRVWIYKYFNQQSSCNDYFLVFLLDNKNIYHTDLFFNDTTIHPLTSESFELSNVPEALNFRVNGTDVIGFATPNDNLLVWNSTSLPYQAENVPKFKSLCLHDGRLFAIDSKKHHLIRYSSNTNPLDWRQNSTEDNTAGSIQLNDFKGELNYLLSFQENLYIFHTYGISKISKQSNEFVVSNVFNTTSTLYGTTAQVCGNQILFLASDGIYKLSQNGTVSKIKTKFNNLFNFVQKDANSSYYDGKYFLACCLNFEDVLELEQQQGTINNCLIEYDILSNTFNIVRGIDVCHMLPLNENGFSKLVLCLNGQSGTKIWEYCATGEEDSTILPKVWQSGKIHFNDFQQERILKEIAFISLYDCNISINVDGVLYTYNVIGNNKVQRLRVNNSGKVFSLKITSNQGNFEVTNLQLLFSQKE